MGAREDKRHLVTRVTGWPSAFPEEALMHIIVDSREQAPYTFENFPKITARTDTVRFGDYTLEIDPLLAAVERKSLPDFVACVGREKDRFTTQVAKLTGAVESPLLIVEADYGHLEMGGWRGRMPPEAVLTGLHYFSNKVPILLCRSRGEAERATVRHLRNALKQRYMQAREFARRVQSWQRDEVTPDDHPQ